MSETTYPGVDEAAQAEANAAGAPVAITVRPACPPDRYRKELPSGEGYVDIMKKMIGKHQKLALQMIGRDSTNFPFALISVVCRFNGRDVTPEDVLEMDYEDCMMLQEETTGRLGKGRTSGEKR